MTELRLKVGVSGGALLLIVGRFVWPQLTVDGITFGLLIVALLPWLSGLVKSAEFPGGWKIEFQDVKAAGDKITGAVLPASAELVRNTTSEVLQGGDPNLALVGLRIEIEKRLRALAKRHRLRSDGSLQGLVEHLRFNDVLHASEASGLSELVVAGNQAAHGAKVAPGVADWASKYGQEILDVLDRKLESESR